MRIVKVRCPVKGCELAQVEVHQGYAIVTPVSVVVANGDGRHRRSLVRGPAATAGRFTLKATMAPPAQSDWPACNCGEFEYPEDLWQQVTTRRVAIAARW